MSFGARLARSAVSPASQLQRMPCSSRFARSFFILAVSAVPMAGQLPTSEQRDLKNFGGDIWSVWTAPVRADRRDLATAGGAVAVVAVSALGDSVIAAWIANNQDALVLRAIAPFREGWIFPLLELPT